MMGYMGKEMSVTHSAIRALNRGRLRVVIAAALFVILGMAVALARNNGTPFIDILYAEDGMMFYSEARAPGLDVLSPYAGYMHLVPRLISKVITLLPVEAVAAAYAVSATALVALLALYVYFASRVLLELWPGRALLAGAMVVPPLAGQAVANLTNLHWYLMFAAFWAVISRPRNVGWTILGASVGAAAALSDPLTALLLPSAAFAVYRYRSRLHGFVVGAVVLGLGVQLLVVLGAEQRVGQEFSWLELFAAYAFRVAGGITVGDVHLTAAWQRAGWSLPIVAAVAITILVALAIAWTHRWRRFIVIAAVLSSTAFFAVPLFIRGTTTWVPIVGQPPPLHTGRYTLIPALFLIVCVAVLVDLAVAKRRLKYLVSGGIAAVWLVSVMAANSFLTPLPNGPSWAEGVDAARLVCKSEPTDTVEVVIAPRSGWKVRLSCHDL